MHIWLDDIRPIKPKDHIPLNEYQWCKTGEEAIEYLKTGKVKSIDFDHDLGPGITGYDVAKWIEEKAAAGSLSKLDYWIHSANIVGSINIDKAMKNAQEFWDMEEPHFKG